jgi:formate hydrogenlyase transcriptional activator
MQQKTPQTDAILKAMQEREKDQLQLLSICGNLVTVTNTDTLSTIVKQQLKDFIGFDNFVICVTDENEKQYHVFFHDDAIALSEFKNVLHDANDGCFNAALQSAEPVVTDLNNPGFKKNGMPTFLQKAQKSGIRQIVALPLHYHKKNPSVLFLFFKKPDTLSRPALRLLKGICFQMALTVSNIIISEKIEKHQELLKRLENEPQKEQPKVIITGNSDDSFAGIIGSGEEMQKVFTLINQVAPSDTGVLLLGESGSGKEVIAHAIHNNSAKKNKAMITVNCAAIPANLIESELFGHEKGSFTGATERRTGKFELAHNSTLFLDEIGELPLEMQTKLLRVLQEREFEPIGSKTTIKVNVRIIAATNRDLQQEVAQGRFRSDLFYRLNIFPIVLPPLRDRREDIPALSRYFIAKYCAKANRPIVSIASKVTDAMLIYTWPGNVRELQHIIERNILLATGPTITKIDFPGGTGKNTIIPTGDHHVKLLEEVEREHILKVIKLCNGRISGPNGAAIKLGIPSTTLISKMQKLGIQKKHLVSLK